MTIVYRLGSKLYINITNKCSCDCVFCLRNTQDGVGDASSLWLEREPSLDEIILALTKAIPANPDIDEIVFCGYGEPMMRADIVIEVSQFIKASLNEKPVPLRLNTNGLAFLMHPGFDVESLAVIDTVSISLNADDAVEYERLARPVYGAVAFESLLSFARQARDYTHVVFSVVEGTINAQRIANCQRIADEMGVTLSVRPAE